jgi:hypothetical protein
MRALAPFSSGLVGCVCCVWLVGCAWLATSCASGSDDDPIGFTNVTQPQVTSVTNPGPEGTTSGTGTGTGSASEDPGPPPTSDDSNNTLPAFECGNGVLDPNEECEGDDLDAQTCDNFGYNGGQLGCTADCRYDPSMCNAAAVCGDGVINADKGESCDCGGQGSPCSSAQLAGLSCANFDSPKGVAFGGGVLKCNSPTACSYNIDACTYCGDNKRNGGEDCDGAELGGQSCQSLGFDAGALSCNVGCTYNTTSCQSFSCGDGKCQASEDSCVCPEDCPEDPNTCSDCECGGQGGPNCYCDIFCVLNFDCCLGGPC